MRKQLARTILAAGTVAAMLSLAVPQAMAAGTWTVTGGKNFTSAQSNGTTFSLKDTTKNLNFSCTKGSGAGTVVNQSMSTNTAIGSITSSGFTSCSGAFGSTGSDSQTAGTVSTLNAGVYAAPVTTGTITNVDHTLSVSSILGNCTAEVKGTAGITYNNTTHVLAFTVAGDNLKITKTNCSFFAVNDAVTFTSGTGGETVTGNPVNPIQVSQP